jgi:hypothetical protein
MSDLEGSYDVDPLGRNLTRDTIYFPGKYILDGFVINHRGPRAWFTPSKQCQSPKRPSSCLVPVRMPTKGLPSFVFTPPSRYPRCEKKLYVRGHILCAMSVVRSVVKYVNTS